jgi:REP element-mobilizing transposase RayT
MPGVAYFVTSNVLRRQKLLDASAREIVIRTLTWLRDAKRLWLLGYVIMDDHFHALLILRNGYTLAGVMRSLKRHTSREINKVVGRTGELWQDGYHDHAVRDEPDFWHHVRYLRENPVRLGLVDRPEDYAWSTAHPTRLGDVDWPAVGYEA